MQNYQIFNNPVYMDERGYFYESYSHNISDKLGILFCQDNISYSHKGVIRGLHYQWDAPMGKLIRVVSGKIIDYIVDIRYGSPDYGKYWQFELSEKNSDILWVPPGYAHGFEALEDSYVMYKCSSYYNKEGESVINLHDEDIGITFTTTEENRILSKKDLMGQSFNQYSEKPKFFYNKEH